jgi:hypothetical protein
MVILANQVSGLPSVALRHHLSSFFVQSEVWCLKSSTCNLLPVRDESRADLTPLQFSCAPVSLLGRREAAFLELTDCKRGQFLTLSTTSRNPGGYMNTLLALPDPKDYLQSRQGRDGRPSSACSLIFPLSSVPRKMIE